VLRTPGVVAVLMVVLFYVLAHNILYTYIAPFLAANGVPVRIDLALLVFGVAALPGIWLTGLYVDRHLYRLSMASILLFCGAVLMLGVSWGGRPWPWRHWPSGDLPLAAPPPCSRPRWHTWREQVDLAQSLLVTTWNTAIAGGGLVGGLLIVHWGLELCPGAAGAAGRGGGLSAAACGAGQQQPCGTAAGWRAEVCCGPGCGCRSSARL
jgi:predicted MFS family arabinose efflux permease